MKCVVFIEHDIVVRHFIHSRVFEQLASRHEVTFVFPEPGYKRLTMDVSALDLPAPYRHLSVHQERLVIWKRLFQVNLLRWRPDRLFRTLRRFHRETMGRKAATFYGVLALPGIFQLFRRWSLKRIQTRPNRELDALIETLRPDLMIHPSVLEGVYINDLVAAAKQWDIPLAVIMNSWDNPSTKRAIVGVPDWLLVWGEQTRRHAIAYAGTAPDRTVMFGAAQFDVYRHPPRLDRNAFCVLHDIDPAATIVLYAGSSRDTDEYSHLAMIEQAIADGELGNVMVVYRPHPWGGGGKNGSRILDREWRHVRIESTMRTYLERLRDGGNSMSFPDYRDTHDVLSAIDALVSPLSTIILEGALHGKPTLCYLPMEETDARHFQLTVNLKHFEDMYEMPEFPIARGRNELLSGIVTMLAQVEDAAFQRRLAKACEFFVESFAQPYGERLATFCEAAANPAESPKAS